MKAWCDVRHRRVVEVAAHAAGANDGKLATTAASPDSLLPGRARDTAGIREFADAVTDEPVAWDVEDLARRSVHIHATALVVDEQDRVERTVEDGPLELVLGAQLFLRRPEEDGDARPLGYERIDLATEERLDGLLGFVELSLEGVVL